jgi:hypothetical protein
LWQARDPDSNSLWPFLFGKEDTMTMKLLNALVLAGVVSLGTSAFAGGLDSADDGPPSGKGEVVTGTIEGQVKKVQPDAVIVTQEPEGKEVRLQLHESTHKGPVKEGDKVVAFVTPGGTTTSIQPKDSRFYR